LPEWPESGCAHSAPATPDPEFLQGDRIAIDAEQNRLDVMVTEDELAQRRARWKAAPYKAEGGTLYKYIKSLRPASEGCVTDE
jgi:dihydroxy-acid dehydratase